MSVTHPAQQKALSTTEIRAFRGRVAVMKLVFRRGVLSENLSQDLDDKDGLGKGISGGGLDGVVSTEELTLQKLGRSVRWSLRTLSGTRGHRAGDTSPLPRRHRESGPGQIPQPRGPAKPGRHVPPG